MTTIMISIRVNPEREERVERSVEGREERFIERSGVVV